LAECPKGRRTFCCDNCVRDFLLAKGGSADVRRYVGLRDNGICACCGRDCLKTEQTLDRLANRWGKDSRRVDTAKRVLAALGCKYAADAIRRGRSMKAGWSWVYGWLLTRCGWSAAQSSDVTKSTWQADHIVPLIEGGGSGMENLRTLCVPCHGRQTAGLARRMKRNR
jgi:hypothetical protein